MSTIRRPFVRALAALAGVAVYPLLADAVLVAPHALFIDARSPSGDVTLVNTSDQAEEISLVFRFGYPTTDSAGNVGVPLTDEPPPGQPSAHAWLRAFPRRLRLEPGQQQRVRVTVTPPTELPNGEYWARMVVTSRPAATPIAVAGGDSAVRAAVTFEVRTVTSVTFRKGPLTTGVRLEAFRATRQGDSLETWVDLVREGTAAYLGSLRFELRSGEQVVRDWSIPVAVYYEQHRRLMLAVEGITPGTYQLHLLVSTAREDIGAEHVLPAAPVEAAVAIDLR